MVVLKFGGSSLSCPECFTQAAKIVKARAGHPFVVVVSAIGNTTDMLLTSALMAASGKEGYLDIFREIEKNHFSFVRAMFTLKEHSRLLAGIKLLLNEAEELAGGIFLTQDLTIRTQDRLLGFGERFSSFLLHALLEKMDVRAELADARLFIRTSNGSGTSVVDRDTTAQLIREHLNQTGQYVVPGFIASDASGLPTSLGRNGSDHTATLIAAALKADELEIWTNVSGVMTADPEKVPQARPIEEMTYEEAMELSTFGAKIIHPPALQPVMQENIPVKIKNTFEPDNPGTLISDQINGGEDPVKGISVMDNIALLTLTGSSMIGIPGIAGRLFRAMSEHKINVVFITQASSEHSITAGVSETMITAAEVAVNDEFSSEIALGRINPVSVEVGLSIVAIVGNNMKRRIGLSGKTFAALGRNGINVVAIAQGSTERNISIVIQSTDVRKALNVLHEIHFLSKIRKVNLFIIGVGNVGSALMQQISGQRSKIREAFSVDLTICGLANSSKMVLNPDGLPPEKWQETLEDGKEKCDLKKFVETVKSYNLRNSIFVDNTASNEVTECYPEVLSSSISVVAANKIAFSGPLVVYQRNKKLAKEHNASLFFEANVGAGLPIIQTVMDLIQSGDKINRIEAVLSGSLNFIFNHYTGNRTFASVVREAQEAGLTEPDPRLDLEGEDVARKILILARESGVFLEPEDIIKKSFLPEECKHAKEIPDFFQSLENQEPKLSSLKEKSEREGTKLRYVASLKNDKATAGLEEIREGHPFYALEGKDNIVLFYTERYTDQPLIIRGAGAGADVTASGVFADIMRIAR